MSIEKDGGKRRSIYAENILRRQSSGKFRIESVYSLDDKDIVWLHLQYLSALLALAGLEVIAWQFHLFSSEKSLQLLIEKVEIEGI